MYPFLSYSILEVVLRFLLSSYTNLCCGFLGFIKGAVQITTETFQKILTPILLNQLLIILPIYFIVGHIFKHSIIRLFTIWILAILCSYIMLILQKHFKTLRVLCGLNSQQPN